MRYGLFSAHRDSWPRALYRVLGTSVCTVAADEDLMAHRDQRLLLALSAHKALIFRIEVGALHF